MRKIYVLDTNVLLSDPNAIYSFDDNEVVIPSVVLQEIDGKKTKMDEVGRNARYTSHQFDELRKLGKLNEGVPLHNGGVLRVVAPPERSQAYDSFLDSSNDTAIIAVAKMIQDVDPRTPVIVVSKDVLVRVKADMFVQAEDYQYDKVITSDDEFYSGYSEVDVDRDVIDAFFNKRRTKQSIPFDVPENHFFLLKNGESQRGLAINKGGYLEHLYKYDEDEFVWGLQARNVEQKMALELLLNPDIPLVTMTGKAGTGKTLLALAAALQQTLDDKIYKRILVARPVVPMGKDIGFLPGEKEEKLRPWMQPIYDNLEYLFNAKDDNELQRKLDGLQGEIQVEALTYIRGRSIPDQFIIIDEAQNLTKHEAKTILTRVGEGSKIVLMGDPEQIDHPYLDAYSNGLTYVTETMKGIKQSGHVMLKKGERSTLAQLCADML